jgi:hypothetical protein
LARAAGTGRRREAAGEREGEGEDDGHRGDGERARFHGMESSRPLGSDIDVETPTEAHSYPAEAERDEGYGRIVVRAGGGTRETHSTSRREIVTLLFEAAGRSLPDWSQPEYPGTPSSSPGRNALSSSCWHGRQLSDAPPSGRCGLWSKADSQDLFDDFTVGAAA